MIVTVLSPVSGFSNAKSTAWIVPGARSGAPCANAGIAIAAPTIAIQVRCVGEKVMRLVMKPAPRRHAAGPKSCVRGSSWTA